MSSWCQHTPLTTFARIFQQPGFSLQPTLEIGTTPPHRPSCNPSCTISDRQCSSFLICFASVERSTKECQQHPSGSLRVAPRSECRPYFPKGLNGASRSFIKCCILMFLSPVAKAWSAPDTTVNLVAYERTMPRLLCRHRAFAGLQASKPL